MKKSPEVVQKSGEAKCPDFGFTTSHIRNEKSISHIKGSKGIVRIRDADGRVIKEIQGGATEHRPMVRTQIYLSRTEHTFLLTEAGRRNIPVAALIRGFIDEKMEIPKDAWANNPMLQDLDDDSSGPEDGAINHDHYVYGSPKRFEKKNGVWTEAASLETDAPGQPVRPREKNPK